MTDQLLKTGLHNLGNTCYMNSVLQVLSATKPFMGYMLSEDSDINKHITHGVVTEIVSENTDNDDTDNHLEIDTKELNKKIRKTITHRTRTLMSHMWGGEKVIRPIKFKRCVDRRMEFFRGTQQHDSQEFLTGLLDKIHEETKTKANISFGDIDVSDVKGMYQDLKDAIKSGNNEKKCMIINKMTELYKENEDYLKKISLIAWEDNLSGSYSTINNIFSGLTISEILCNECNNIFVKFDRFDILTLHLPDMTKNYKLEDLLNNYISVEKLEGDNKYNCSYCGKKTDSNKRTMLYHTPETLIILIKVYQGNGRSLFKLNNSVMYNKTMNISEYIYSGVDRNYELYGTVNHSGGLGGGHYYSYVKHIMTDEWFLCNDSSVRKSTEEEVLKSNGYLLFYRLI